MLYLGIGLVITGGTYLYAMGSDGGHYVVSWGFFLFGAIRIVKGFLKGPPD